jgi:hypothetical protein
VPRPGPRPAMVSSQENQERSKLLDRFFFNILEGKSQIARAAEAQRFLEAICNKTDKSDCIERLASSEGGKKALHNSLTLDTSARFINGWGSKLLGFLSDPLLKKVCNGEFLNQVLWAIVEPPFFWNAIVRLMTARSLEPETVERFACKKI